MNFSSMNNTQKSAWLSWCKSHAWGKDAQIIGGLITDLKDFTVDAANQAAYIEITAVFDNTDDLKAWAGY